MKKKEKMEFCEYIHIWSHVTEHIHKLYTKGMEIQYIWFNTNHVFRTEFTEEEIQSIIDFNLKTEIYN